MMLDVLYDIEEDMEVLVRQSGWNSMYINYHPPVVERLWRQLGDYRLYLHRIHPCTAEQALLHPHPWPSAIRVLEGSYEMGIAYGKGMTPPPIAAKMIMRVRPRTTFCYEMVDPDGWHYVRPIGDPSLSIMVTGKPWEREAPRSTEPLLPMDPAQAEELLQRFRELY